MRSRHVFHAVDSHTEGMPTRVITGGIGTLPGATMAERRAHFVAHRDAVRTLLMYEPRGHAAMSGAVLQPPTRPDADFGVLFMEVSGCLPMCGHGTIGVATVLVETGMVAVTEPVTTVRLDTPAGLVTVDVRVEDGAAASVTLTNVPAFSAGLDLTAKVPGFGDVPYDLAYGGNFYAMVRLADLGLPFDRSRKDELLAAGL
ncbi:proline racemase family protein, partial [Streptomyces drozdowiczii]